MKASLRIGMLLLLPGLAAPANAQITLNLNALDALPEAASPPPRHVRRHTERRPAHRTAKAHAHAPAVAGAKPAATAPPAAVATALPTVPATPPPAPPPSVAKVAPPAASVPATSAPAAPAPPVPPVVASAAPASAPPPAAASHPPPPPAQVASAPSSPPARTVHVGFAAGQSDLSAADTSAIAALAHDMPRNDTTSFEVAAHAPAPDGDASTARRLSLARALAIRGALVGAGVPAASIYVRALGAPRAGQGGNPDTAVVTVMGANDTESKQASQK